MTEATTFQTLIQGTSQVQNVGSPKSCKQASRINTSLFSPTITHSNRSTRYEVLDMSFSVHATNRVNNIYVMGKEFIQGINDTYMQKNFHNNFTEHGVKLVLSSEWTTSESEKTGLYGNIYDFVVDYKPIHGVGPIYDMHRYLMSKHNISRA